MMTDWRVILSAAIGLSMAAGIVLAVEELFWMKSRGRLTRSALREMAMSLSTLPPNVVVSVVAGGWWVTIYAARERARSLAHADECGHAAARRGGR